MKKRLLAMLLALVLVFSLLPGAAIAEGEEHVHCLCGAEKTKGTVCTACDSEAVVWTASSTMPTASGHYYLTGNVSAAAQFLNGGEQISLCLHGQTVTSAIGKKFLYLNNNNVYNITDCTAEVVGGTYKAGSMTGVTGVDTYGSTIRINAGCTLNWYGGKLTGNTAKDSGIIYVDGSSSASVSGGIFNMYGGEISGNTCQRGTVYGVSTGTNSPVIRILGGTITGNHAAGTGDAGGGAGVYAFDPVTIGGDARIFGNTGNAANKNQDMFLRNDGTFAGAVIVSPDVPLEAGAQVNYGLYVQESDPADLKFLTGTPADWTAGWVTLDGENVCYAQGKFYLESANEQEHIHCLCGATTAMGEACTSCGTEAVIWTGVESLPKESGYYYLTGNVSTGAVIPNAGADIKLCLHGRNITSAAGKKIWYVNNGASLAVTDCAEAPGVITGCKNECAVQVAPNSAFSLYGGKLAGITSVNDGVILLEKGNTTTPGGTFTMYGGEISGNTVNRGTITMANATGQSMNAIVRIWGGIITGNHATGTSVNNGGGAGILAMGPVEIGGDAKIYGNTAAAGPADIYIRNDQKGALIISSEKPLTEGAQVGCGLYTAEADITNLKTITGTPENWDNSWITLDGSSVCYANGKFYLLPSADAHVHCLCGAETAFQAVCPKCGTEAVLWNASDVFPTAEGYYYLTGDVKVAPAVYNSGVNTAVCLHGHTVTSKEGRKIAYISGGASLTVTDCAEIPGQLTGVTTDNTIHVGAGSTFYMYGGKISGNETPSIEGVIRLDYGTASVAGGAFTMHGGEISGNTCQRGTIMTKLATGSNQQQVVRILGGTITGNHATGTLVTTGGGAGLMVFCPVEVGGDAKIYGNTAAAGPADLYIRNDQKGALVISSEKPLTDGAQILCGLFTSEQDPYDLQCVTGTPSTWSDAWITYDGGALRYEDGKFSNARKIIYSNHDHDGKQWISVTEQTGLLPERTGYYVLDGDVELQTELKILSGQVVTLCLNGHDLTAAPGLRHFYVAAGGSLTICDCTEKTDKDGNYTAGRLTGADGTAGGGAIRMAPASVVNLYGGKITGNHTAGEGGAFYLEGCTLSNPTPAELNMYGGEISENTADKGFGGAIRFAGAPDDLLAATFHMEGGTIRNHKSYNYGGAIHAPGKATIELMGGVIENNATVGGGAVSINGASTVILDGTIIRNNTAEKWGGGLYLRSGATMEMRGGEISGNSAKIGAGILLESEGTNLTLSGGKITKNAAGTAGGGGVYVGVKCVMTMEGGDICENTSKAGGAGISVVTSELTMNGGNICHNRAATWGAGLLVSTDAKFTMNGGSVNSNYTPKVAAGIYAWCSEVVINKGSVNDNVAEDNTGGILLTGSRMTMNGGSVSGNLGNTNSGAGITCEQANRTVDGVKVKIPSHLVMTGGSVSYNKTPKASAGVQLKHEGTTFVMYGGTVSHNESDRYACGVYVGKGTSFSMHGGSVCYNTLKTSGVAGVFHDGGTGNHTGGEIYGNVSPVSGGGFCASGQDNVVYAKNLKIYNNQAKVGAGVLVQIRATLHMEDCKIYDNYSTMHGAGVYMHNYTHTTITDCVVRNNRAEVDGGGLWMWATAHLTMDGCEVYGNTAIKGDGGGIWTRGDTVNILNCVIRDNQAAGWGGGFYAGRMGAATKGRVDYIHMENTTFQNNTAGKQGGGIYLGLGSDAKLHTVTFRDNKATAEGGALWVKENLTMHAVTATGNVSGGEGYAVYLADSGYDGHSYLNGLIRMSGDMKIHDNSGGDLYLGEKVSVICADEGLAENTKIHVNLHSGLLTQRIWGSYNYEGGNCDYIITYGDRSMTEPEYAEPAPETPEDPSGEATEPFETPTEGEQEQPKGNTGLIVGIGAVVAVIAAAAVIIVLAAKKKKGAK